MLLIVAIVSVHYSLSFGLELRKVDCAQREYLVPEISSSGISDYYAKGGSNGQFHPFQT